MLVGRGVFVLASLCVYLLCTTSSADEHSELTSQLEKNTDVSTKQMGLKTKILVGGAEYSDLSNETTSAGVRFNGQFDYKFIEQLQFHSEIHLALLAQRSQQDIPIDSLEEGFRLKEAFVDYTPWTGVHFQAGVVNQERQFLEIPALADDRGFPGFIQQASFGSEEYRWQVFAEEAIPTSRSLDPDRVQKEALPSYFSQGAKLTWHADDTFSVTPFALHYTYLNLPSVVAVASYPIGNIDVLNAGTPSASFPYPFDGVVGGIMSEWKFAPHYSIDGGYQAIRNLRAPPRGDSGGLASFGVCFCFAKVTVHPRVFAYYNEEDTAPAFYNDARYGHNNRQGEGGEIKVGFPDWKFSAVGRFFNDDVINTYQEQQSHGQFFELFLETNDVTVF